MTASARRSFLAPLAGATKQEMRRNGHAADQGHWSQARRLGAGKLTGHRSRRNRVPCFELVLLSLLSITSMVFWAANITSSPPTHRELTSGPPPPRSVAKSDSAGDAAAHVAVPVPPASAQAPSTTSRVLMGVFCRREDAAYRAQFRALFALHPDVCSLGAARDAAAACPLVYAFVIGGADDPHAPTAVVNDTRPVLAPHPAPLAEPRPYGDDVVFLNIRENMNEGKTATWLHYATAHLAGPLGLDYVGKMDNDTLLRLDDFFRAQQQSLPPAPYNIRTFVGCFVDKRKLWTDRLNRAAADKRVEAAKAVMRRREVFFERKFAGVHVYPQGQFYLMSTDLAAGAVAMAQSKRVEWSAEGPEDHDTGVMAFAAMEHADGPIRLVMIAPDLKWWRHPLKHGESNSPNHQLWKDTWQAERNRLRLLLERGNGLASPPAARRRRTQEDEGTEQGESKEESSGDSKKEGIRQGNLEEELEEEEKEDDEEEEEKEEKKEEEKEGDKEEVEEKEEKEEEEKNEEHVNVGLAGDGQKLASSGDSATNTAAHSLSTAEGYIKHPGAWRNCTPSPSDTARGEDGARTVIVGCRELLYRAPVPSFRRAPDAEMITGVLSSSAGRARRQSVRQTWGRAARDVYFVIAGEWTAIEEEYHQHQDIIWFDMEEDYEALTYKTLGLFAVVEQLAREVPKMRYRYILKADDDSYVDMEGTKDSVRDEGVDYWGDCAVGNTSVKRNKNRFNGHFAMSVEEYPDATYPPYCQGGGYVVSKAFVHCAVSSGHVSNMKYFKFEDVAVGMLANRCHVTVTATDKVKQEWHWKTMKGKLIQHNVMDAETMLDMDHRFIKSRANNA